MLIYWLLLKTAQDEFDGFVVKKPGMSKRPRMRRASFPSCAHPFLGPVQALQNGFSPTIPYSMVADWCPISSSWADIKKWWGTTERNKKPRPHISPQLALFQAQHLCMSGHTDLFLSDSCLGFLCFHPCGDLWCGIQGHWNRWSAISSFSQGLGAFWKWY